MNLLPEQRICELFYSFLICGLYKGNVYSDMQFKQQSRRYHESEQRTVKVVEGTNRELPIYLGLYSPFVGRWQLFQFLNPLRSR
jgi:hypothetical protein